MNSGGNEEMKKIGMISALIAMMAACAAKEPQVQRTTDENGAEIVLNKIEPFRSKGAPAALDLEEEWSLDTGNDEIAKTGLAEIGAFDIDSRGNVYFAAPKADEKTILKFDRAGRPVAAFGRKGQGPGEIQGISSLFVTDLDEIAVTNEGNNRLTVFGEDGKLLRETPIPSSMIALIPLPNGLFLTWSRMADPKPDALFEFPIALTGSDLKTFKILDTGLLENPMTGERLRGTYHIQSWSVSKGRIFTGHQDRGYDIFVFDLDGRPLRKIRKEFKPIPVPEAHKKEFLKQFEAPAYKVIRDKVYFPADMPPFIGFTADEAGRLFVMTYETGERPGESVFDIFDVDGVFVLRKPIPVFHNFTGMFLKVRNDRLYCVQEQENGEKAFRVYRMNWK
jgi:hypothetical protein